MTASEEVRALMNDVAAGRVTPERAAVSIARFTVLLSEASAASARAMALDEAARECDELAALREGYAESTAPSYRLVESFAAETLRLVATRIRNRRSAP